jgi:hypothetical protein
MRRYQHSLLAKLLTRFLSEPDSHTTSILQPAPGHPPGLASNGYPVEIGRLTDTFLASPAARRPRFTTNIVVDPGNSSYESSQLDLTLDE